MRTTSSSSSNMYALHVCLEAFKRNSDAVLTPFERKQWTRLRKYMIESITFLTRRKYTRTHAHKFHPYFFPSLYREKMKPAARPGFCMYTVCCCFNFFICPQRACIAVRRMMLQLRNRDFVIIWPVCTARRRWLISFVNPLKNHARLKLKRFITQQIGLQKKE